MYLMKINHIKGLACMSLALALASCTSGFEDINRPGGKLDKESLGRENYNISSFLIQLENVSFPEQENDYQMNFDLIGNYLGRFFTYANDGFTSKNYARLNAKAGWISAAFGPLTKAKSAFAEIEGLAKPEELNYNWALILRAHAFLMLTDKFGPMPFGLDPKNPSAYNSQEQIYKQLIADLTVAARNLKAFALANPSARVNEAADKIYGGDFSKWYRLANSLKLRMAVRMRYAAPTLAKQYAEEAVADGVIESAADNLYMSYTPRGLYKTSVEWGDSRAGADIDSYMNGYNDPRISKYFAAPAEGAKRTLQGCLAAAEITSKNKADAIYSAAVASPNSRDPWLTAAEMWFCRAEGALAGWTGMGATVQEAYERGVKESFAQWGVDGAVSYLQSERQPAAYTDAVGGFGRDMSAVSTITPKWDSSASTEEQLERIITQKWIALYPNGQEAWSEIRRTGYPKVFDLPVDTGTGLQVPNRIPYDPNEQTRNAAAYRAGVALLGGPDDYTTRLWWQKK